MQRGLCFSAAAGAREGKGPRRPEGTSRQLTWGHGHHEGRSLDLILRVAGSFWIFFFLIYSDFYFFHFSWFTVSCQFLLYSKVTQSHIYILFLALSSIMFQK